MKKLIAMLIVAGMLVTTGIGCSGGDTKAKDKSGTGADKKPADSGKPKTDK